MTRPTVVVRGGGEMASAGARLLFLAGFPVVVLERAAPLAVRRTVCFAQAVFTGDAEVEGTRARLVDAAVVAPAKGHVAVAVDPEGAVIARLQPAVVVDARMAKVNLGTRRDQAALVIGLGPGFTAGLDVHAVVETNRGPDLGRVIWDGAAEADTGRPAEVLRSSDDRVLRAPCAGTFRATARIGTLVNPHDVLGIVGDAQVRTPIAGLVRGLLADGVDVAAGIKIGDVDPRGSAVDPHRLSDKARAIAAGVLEAVAVGLGR